MSEFIKEENLDEVSGGVIINGVEYCQVKAGDTLSEIAERYHVSLSELCAANNIVDPHFIKANTMLVIPKKKK